MCARRNAIASSGVATPIAASSAFTWSSIRSGTGCDAPAASRQVGGLRLRAWLIDPSSTMPAASATRSASTRLNVVQQQRARRAPAASPASRRRGSPSRRCRACAPRSPAPRASADRTARACSGSCGDSSPSQSRRACAARTARTRALPAQVAIDAPARLRILAQRRQHRLGRQRHAGSPRRPARGDLLVDPVGVVQRLLVVALRAIAIEEPDVARELLQPLAIDGVVAGLARRRDVRLHARRQHRQRRRDAEHLEVVVLARAARRLPLGVELVVRQRDERLAVVVRLGRVPARRRPAG